MYSNDPNINTAVERQADRMYAMRASHSSQSFEQDAPEETGSPVRKISVVAKATLALAATAPIALALAWVLAR
jgi:hypothetical protein